MYTLEQLYKHLHEQLDWGNDQLADESLMENKSDIEIAHFQGQMGALARVIGSIDLILNDNEEIEIEEA